MDEIDSMLQRRRQRRMKRRRVQMRAAQASVLEVRRIYIDAIDAGKSPAEALALYNAAMANSDADSSIESDMDADTEPGTESDTKSGTDVSADAEPNHFDDLEMEAIDDLIAADDPAANSGGQMLPRAAAADATLSPFAVAEEAAFVAGPAGTKAASVSAIKSRLKAEGKPRKTGSRK